MLFASKLKKKLSQALEGKLDLASAIDDLSDETVSSAAEAELVVQALRRFPIAPDDSEFRVRSPLGIVIGWFQAAEDEKAIAVFKRLGAPELLRVYDRSLEVAAVQDGASDLAFLLKIVAMYAPDGGVERIASAARSPLLADEYLWSVILQIVADPQHPWTGALLEALRDPLPSAFAGVAYLDFANAVARAGGVEHHPFDTDEGFARLRAFANNPDPDEFSYAHSAAAAIPFLSEGRRNELLALCEQHADSGVRIEAAWAAASIGDDRGIATLQRAASDPRTATLAIRYLDELGASDRIPLVSRTAEFQAMAEMCEWLAHPSEFGRAPETIEQVDSRELYWPPTNDVRRVWLFRYGYPPNEPGEEADSGLGMVGSVTFALFGETTADKSAEEAYALHCAWELEMNEDPRAPAERTVEAGMRILGRHNAGFS